VLQPNSQNTSEMNDCRYPTMAYCPADAIYKFT
jgi:hypothetical protein